MSNLKLESLANVRQYLDEIANLYASSFGEGNNPSEGWGERAACWQNTCTDPGKQAIVPYVEVGTPCPKCATPMNEAYPLDWTVKYILSELAYPNPIGFLGFIRSELVAVVWGYETSIEDIVTDKYRDDEEMQKLVANRVTEVRPDAASQSRHISEVFVSPSARRQFFATELTKAMIKTPLPITVRTLATSSMASIARRIRLQQVIYEGEDTVKPKRIFFVSPDN
ncbi:MAG: hypothetical protein ABII21_04575 [bacterium]